MQNRIEVLTRALQDEDETVRQVAAASLEKIESRVEFISCKQDGWSVI